MQWRGAIGSFNSRMGSGNWTSMSSSGAKAAMAAKNLGVAQKKSLEEIHQENSDLKEWAIKKMFWGLEQFLMIAIMCFTMMMTHHVPDIVRGGLVVPFGDEACTMGMQQSKVTGIDAGGAGEIDSVATSSRITQI